MRDFYGFYSNGKYKVGLSGTVWVYDKEDRLIGRFKDTPYSYIGAFVPGTDRFVCHSNECHLVVYDLAEMQRLKKIKTSRFGADDNGGMAFSTDGKRLYCVQAHRKLEGICRLVVYDTESFEVLGEYLDEQNLLIHEVEIDSDGTCYLLCSGERDPEKGWFERDFVGIFRDGEIVEKRAYQESWLDVSIYFCWKRTGFTKKAAEWTVGDDLDPALRAKPSSLKKLFETGRL